jgi:hypothetical protein
MSMAEFNVYVRRLFTQVVVKGIVDLVILGILALVSYTGALAIAKLASPPVSSALLYLPGAILATSGLYVLAVMLAAGYRYRLCVRLDLQKLPQTAIEHPPQGPPN